MIVSERQEFGQYVVADPKICGGDLIFKGTRILVNDVLFLIGQGFDWQQVTAEYDGRLTREAIVEAIQLGRQV